MFRAAAVILPLVALSYLSISQQDKINSIYTQMASLNPFTPNEIVEEVIETTAEKVIEIELAPEIIETPIMGKRIGGFRPTEPPPPQETTRWMFCCPGCTSREFS